MLFHIWQKKESKPWKVQEWCIPPEHECEFVVTMEDVLDVYTRKHDKKYPLVCMDEVPRQLIGEIRMPVPAQPGRKTLFDTKYKRNRTCEIFMFTAPFEGGRRAEVTEQRTRLDGERQIQKLVAIGFPNAEKIVLVMNNLNTHTIGSLYKAFLPEEARQLQDKIKIQRICGTNTPKHGNWLNMTEIEINVLVNHGLSKRIISTDDARIKLKRLYSLFI